MANSANYFGLRPVKHINGSSWNGLTEKCYVGALEGNAMYIGDPVRINVTSGERHAGALYTTVELSAMTTGVPVYGVITSFDSSEDMNDKYVKRPASTEVYVNVCVDPTVIYQIRDDGTGTPSLDWPFLNSVGVDAGGSAITGLSGFGLSGTDVAVDLNDPLLIIRLANLPDNTLADYAIWEVLLNTHQLRDEGVGAGSVTGVA